MATAYPKGAEWRKWDLHIHTPGTAKNDQFVSENDVWEEYLQRIEQNTDITVIGITDYFSIENYVHLKALQAGGRLLGKIIMPNVELRILPVTDSSTPINLHVIFDPALDIEAIEREFFRKLKFSYQDAEYSCIRTDLINLGRAYRTNPTLEENAAWKEGIGQFNIPFSDLKKLFKGSILEAKCLIGVSNSSADGNSGIQHSSLAATRQEIYRFSDFIFSGNPNDTTYFLGKGCDASEKVIADYGSIKPCFTGSDAHSLDEVFLFHRERYTWIKADPTFEGLKQVIIEPEERVFIGDKPPLLDRISKNRTKYIKQLSVSQVDGYDDRHGVWFKDVSIPLNSELVAIIGNKGSGKSAIADVAALCSNYPANTDFSFLTKEKFKKKGLAANFTASTTWESGKLSKINLNEQPENTELLVKYLPQGQFERLTNEIRTAEEFQREIESVVFSHIPDSEKLGALSFDELIGKTTSSVNSEIEGYKGDIRDINKKIIELERKSTKAYREEVANKFKKKQEELNALVEPPPVSDPNEAPEKRALNKAVNEIINGLKGDIQVLQTSIQTAESEKKATLEVLQKLKTIKSDIRQKEIEINRFISEKEFELSAYDIDVKNLISIKADYSELDLLILDKEGCLQKAKEKLGESEVADGPLPLPRQLKAKELQLNVEKSKLDAEQQQYQKYLADKASWQKDQAAILGAADRLDTVQFYQHELDYLDNNLISELKAKYDDRRAIVRIIFDKKQDVISVYKEARNRLNKIINQNQDTLKNYKIEVDASLVKSAGFNSKFLDFILQNKMGTFHSRDGGEAQLIRLLAEIDFDVKDDVLSLLDNLISALRFDQRTGQKNEQRAVAEQVKDIPALYDYLFSLEFLEKNYQLKQGDKELEQLSPGERGALLLVFYLLLDNNDIPLVIDQPEDNLDNHSVATILVPFIRVAKKKRQIIMVTHNPNLAVVSDAEQVIYVDLDKEKNYVFSTVSGSIEDKAVNKKIVDVLEGAMPAFNTRKRKYYE